MKVSRAKTILLIVIASIMVGCAQSPPTQELTTPPEEYYTQAAQTMFVQMTEDAPHIVPTDTKPVFTETTSPTITSTDTQGATNTSEMTTTVEPSITLRPTIRPGFEFWDDFKTNTGWVEDTGNNFGFQYVNGTYVIFNNLLNAAIYSIREREFSDVYIEVDATKINGPTDGYYGIVCQFVDPSNYYALVIGSGGFYGFSKMEDGEYQFVETGNTDEDVINPDNEMNRIRAECVGEKLILIANGELLLEVDDDFVTGAIGLVVGNQMTDIGTEVVFDNFYVLSP